MAKGAGRRAGRARSATGSGDSGCASPEGGQRPVTLQQEVPSAAQTGAVLDKAGAENFPVAPSFLHAGMRVDPRSSAVVGRDVGGLPGRLQALAKALWGPESAQG